MSLSLAVPQTGGHSDISGRIWVDTKIYNWKVMPSKKEDSFIVYMWRDWSVHIMYQEINNLGDVPGAIFNLRKAIVKHYSYSLV